MRRNVEDFSALPLSDEAKRKILWDNAQRLIGG
jgi:predicted TIM-barrel fold metal-dependent hydrolase